MRIVPLTADHAEAVLKIYQLGLDTGDASFETTAPAWEVWDRAHRPDHRFVALAEDSADDTGEDSSDGTGEVLGWVAVSPYSGRAVYAGVVEHSVYVSPVAKGQGVGRALLAALIESCETGGVWTIQSGVFPENTASLALHERAGFRVVGRRERIGATRAGRWRDVLLLERRSQHIGQQTSPGQATD